RVHIASARLGTGVWILARPCELQDAENLTFHLFLP
ncbi:hypothetical protein A2U01_0108227, partial [Trifolium medium]|nr:hypothetical protein [Trifolium medium]